MILGEHYLKTHPQYKAPCEIISQYLNRDAIGFELYIPSATDTFMRLVAWNPHKNRPEMKAWGVKEVNDLISETGYEVEPMDGFIAGLILHSKNDT